MLYLRFVDDIFMIWTKSEKKLKNLMKDLNTKYPSIKFDFEYSKDKIEFLDTVIRADHRQKLQTTLNLKPASSQNSFFFSTFQEYVKHSRALIEKSVDKGYDQKKY